MSMFVLGYAHRACSGLGLRLYRQEYQGNTFYPRLTDSAV